MGLGNLFQRKAVISPGNQNRKPRPDPRVSLPLGTLLPCTTHSQFSGLFLPHGLSQLQFLQVDDGCAEYSLSLSLLFSIPGPTSSSQPQPLETLPRLKVLPQLAQLSQQKANEKRRGCSLSERRGKLRKGRKVKVSRNPQCLRRTEHKDTQDQ